MPQLPTTGETLLTGLSDFWHRFFADKDQLNVLYSATEELLGQAYLDIVTQVLNQNLQNVPLFNREFWHLFTIREDELLFEPGEDWPYRLTMQDGLREFVFLLNRIYNPTASFEKDIDFVLVDDEMHWKDDPFEQSDGVPLRQLDIVPTIYRQGTDGVVGVGPTSTFSILGNLQEGADGQVTNVDRFESPSADFTAQDIGRQIVHSNTLGTGPQETRTVTGVLNSTTVFCTPDADTTSGPAALQWALRDEGYFNEFDVGRQIELTNPSDARDTHLYTIDTVVDDGVPTDTSLVVTFTEQIDTVFEDTARIQWSHQSTSRVRQLAYWIPDAFFDRENLYLSFGYLINRFEPSTESYRALIDGIFRYFMLGPSLARIESALNVAVGVPVVREDGEIFQSLDTAPSGLDRVNTNRNSYEIPVGSLRSEIEIGDELDAFQALTDIFEATDYVDRPTWYYGAVIPEELLSGPSVLRRNVDPRLYPLVCGSDKWVCGDPQLYCGADETRFVETRREGSDVYHTGDESFLRFRDTVFLPEDVGKILTIEDVEYEITNVGTDPDPYATVTDGSTDPFDLTPVYAAATYSGVNPATGDEWEFAAATFVPADVGRLIEVTAAVTITLGLYRIEEVLSPTQVKVVEYDTGAAVAFPADPGFTARLGLRWEVEVRSPLRHSTGYVMMRNYLRAHIFQVSYDYGSYPDLAYPRPEEDIRDVLDAGKPSYTFMLVVPRSKFRDRVQVVDSVEFFGVLNYTDSMQEVDWRVSAGGGSIAGEHYAYSQPAVAWMDSVRRAEFSSITEIPQASEVDKVVVSSALEGGTSPTLTVTFWAWTGMMWVPTGDVEVLDPAGSDLFILDTVGNRIAISVSETGTADADSAGVSFGLIADVPRTVVFVSPTLSSSTGAYIDSTNQFQDTNFFFNVADVLRELIVKVGFTEYRYRITALVDEHTVEVVEAYPGTTPSFVGTTDLEWYIGRPTRTTTPTVCGGVPSDVVKTTPDNYIVPWPVHMMLKD